MQVSPRWALNSQPYQLSPADTPPFPWPVFLLSHRWDLLFLPVLPICLSVPHQRLPLLQLSLVLGHQRCVDAAIRCSCHHHDADDAAHHAGDHHCADGTSHAHGSVASTDAICRRVAASSSRVRGGGVVARVAPVRNWRSAGAESPAAGWSPSLSRSRSLPSIFILKLEAVVEHFHWNASDVSPTQILWERALNSIHFPPCGKKGHRWGVGTTGRGQKAVCVENTGNYMRDRKGRGGGGWAHTWMSHTSLNTCRVAALSWR